MAVHNRIINSSSAALCTDGRMCLMQQNLGAIIRSAYFLGVSGIAVSFKNSAPLSPVVSKVSSGVAEILPIHSCTKLPQFLLEAQKSGWTVVGASNSTEAISCTAFHPQKPVVLVVGKCIWVMLLFSTLQLLLIVD